MGEQENANACVLPNMRALSRDTETLTRAIRHYLEYHLGRFLGCNQFYLYESLAYTVRDRLMSDWRNTWCAKRKSNARRGHYLSLEFLIGRLLRDALCNLGLTHDIRAALLTHGVDLDVVADLELDLLHPQTAEKAPQPLPACKGAAGRTEQGRGAVGLQPEAHVLELIRRRAALARP